MFKLLRKIFQVGVVTEKIPAAGHSSSCASVGYANQEFDLGMRCKKIIAAKFGGSFAIRQVDAGSCNGCELEIHALNNAFYDIERFGIHFVASPRHADALLVTGPVTQHMEMALLATYEAMPSPKIVIAVGNCALDGGEFSCSYACLGAVAKILPVDAVISGCPPTPLELLRGILSVLDVPCQSR